MRSIVAVSEAVGYPVGMKVRILCLVALVVLLGVAASSVLLHRAAVGSDAIYTVATAEAHLIHDPQAWTGRTVLIRGEVQLIPGSTPISPPGAILVDPAPRHIAVGLVDLTSLFHLSRSGGRPAPAALLLTQASTSHQRIDMQGAATYRVQLGMATWNGRRVPRGQLV